MLVACLTGDVLPGAWCVVIGWVALAFWVVSSDLCLLDVVLGCGEMLLIALLVCGLWFVLIY